MRTTTFRKVFDSVVRLHGRNPRANITDDMRDAIVDRINDRVRTICNLWRWPEWELTEERAFRQVWNANHQYLRSNALEGVPDEIFYLGDDFQPSDTGFGDNSGYYRVISTAEFDPPIGTLPTDTTYFEVIDPVDTFVAYDQTCKRAIGMVLGVYSQNPRVPTGSRNGLLRYMPSEKGVDVLCPGARTVFISYKMPVPEYTMQPFTVGTVYLRSQIVFDSTIGECFQALIDTPSLPADSNNWRRVPFPTVWADYVTKGAFADTLMEFDQGGNTDLQAKMVLNQYWGNQANDAFQQEVDTLAIQGQKLQWNFCQPTMCWCDTQPWSGGTVSTLSDACDDELGWIYPIMREGAFVRWQYRYEITALLVTTDSPSLQGLPTANYFVVGSLVELVINVSGSKTRMTFKLVAGIADLTDPGHVSPLDYNSSTNNVHWEKCG